MAQINIAEIRPSGTIEGKVDALYDAYFMMRKQMMYYLSGALDSENIQSISTDLLIAGEAKISTAFIEDLEVGSNVTMGANATISWGQVTGTGDIPLRTDLVWDNIGEKPTDLLTQSELITALTNYVTNGEMTTALANTINTGNFSTIITKDYIASMNLVVGDEILMGANATISWNKVTDKPSIPIFPSYITETKITATTIESPTINGGTINGGTINVTTDVNVGDRLHVGSSLYQYIEIYNDYGAGYLRTSSTNAIKFFDNGQLWSAKGIALGNNSSIGCHDGLNSYSATNLINLSYSLITMYKPVTFYESIDLLNRGVAGLKLSDSLDANGYGIESLLSITTSDNFSITASGYGDTISLNSYGNLNLKSSSGRIVLSPYSSYGVQLNGYLGFFGASPSSKTSVSDPSSISTGSAPSAWTQSWGGYVKTDLDNLKSKLTDLINALQSYGLV